MTVDIAVIGAGVAGLTAVQQVLTMGNSVAHIIGTEPIGGLVCNIGELQGWPAGAEPVSGLDLAIGLLSANAANGAIEVPADVTSLAREDGGFRITHNDGELFARRIIAATGARLRMLDIPRARHLVGRGVSQCGWCDGPLYRDKHVAVIGGGDSAIEEALHLAQFAVTVTLLTHGDAWRARPAYIKRAQEAANITMRKQCSVLDIRGDEHVSAIRIADRRTSKQEELPCSGVFVFIGLKANAALFVNHVKLDDAGNIITDATLQTWTPGLYAIGAVRSGYCGRLAHAVGDAAIAALAATQALR